MKLFAAILLMISTSAWAQQRSQFQIPEGRLHKSGKATVEILNTNRFVTRITYALEKKGWVPLVSNDDLKGVTEVELPEIFRDERGYLELEMKKLIHFPQGSVRFLKRTDWKQYRDGFLIEIIPASGKARLEAIYHPDIPGVGFGDMDMTITSAVPGLNGYRVKFLLR